MSLILSDEDQKYFKGWIELNLASISWEGRYLDEFNQFWSGVFKPNLTPIQQIDLLDQVLLSVKEGPIVSWLKWIKEKFLCYLFVYKNYSLSELSQASAYSVSEIGTILRNFFVDRFPHLEEVLSEKFQIGNNLAAGLNLKFKDLQDEFKISESLRGASENEIMTGLEVTLYSDWNKLKIITGVHGGNEKNLTETKKRKTQKFRFFSELLILFIVGAILIFGIKLGNSFYENYLVKNISLFEPNFLKLETDLSFKSETSIGQDDIEISMDELDALEKIESKKVFSDSKEVNRYEVESDVVLTSVDSLPKDFDIADLEQSNYEEIRKGGYRNMRYGRRKAYRVMMTSVDARKTKDQLNEILPSFGVKQVDNVKPGTEIPGGIYFNLYVPRQKLKDFLSKVSSLEQATILESKTSRGGPAGTNKVFIWVKSI